MNYSKNDLIFFAGLLEGDGAMWIAKSIVNSRIYLNAYVSITNNSLPLLLHLQEKFNGTIHTKYRNIKEYKHITYQWHLSSSNIHLLLSDVFPFLITKQDIVSLILEFRKTISQKGSKPSKEDINTRLMLYDKYIKIVESKKNNILKIKSSPLSPSSLR